MMWVVDGRNNKVHTVRLHPDLFDETLDADFVPQRASTRVTGHRELTVSWQPPAVGSAGISGWQVQWRQQATSGQIPAAWIVVDIDDPSQRSYNIENLMPGTDYVAQVLAVYTDGRISGYSETAGATAIGRPGQIRLKVIPDVTLLALSWNAPSDGGGTITHYHVEHRLAATATEPASDYTTAVLQVDGGSPTALTHTIDELVDDKRYDVRVRAVNAAGRGDWSATVTAAPGEQTVPAGAKVAADSSDDYKLIELTFNRALDAAGLPAASRFGVRIDNATAAAPGTVAVVADDDNVVNTVVLTMSTEVAAGVPVTVTYTDPNPGNDLTGVLQSALDGTDALSFEDEVVLNRPGAPRLLAVERHTDPTTLFVRWEFPEFDGADDSSDDISDHFVQWRDRDENQSWGDPTREARIDSDSAQPDLVLLEGFFTRSGSTYEVRVVAANAAGRGVPSDVSEVFDVQQPTKPDNLGLVFAKTETGFEARPLVGREQFLRRDARIPLAFGEGGRAGRRFRYRGRDGDCTCACLAHDGGAGRGPIRRCIPAPGCGAQRSR